MKKRSLTIAEMRAKYAAHLPETEDVDKSNIWGYWVLRNASYHPAWLCLKLGISANVVTYIGFIIGCIGCVSLAFGNHGSMIAGAVLLNIWVFLDFVDGSVARGSDSTSSYGKFLDVLSGYTVPALLFVCAGIGLFNHPDDHLSLLVQLFSTAELNKGIFLLLGGWTSVFYLFPFLFAHSFGSIFSRSSTALVAQTKTRSLPTKLFYQIGFTLHDATGVVMPVVLVATVLDFLSVVLFLWALIHTVASIYMLVQILNGARSSSD